MLNSVLAKNLGLHLTAFSITPKVVLLLTITLYRSLSSTVAY